MDADATCAIGGCGKAAHSKGWCRQHYMRWYRYGDPLAMKQQRATGPDEVRWMQKVCVESPGCWVWQGEPTENGYGQYTVGGGAERKTYLAHRYVYELLVGPIPEGLDLDHLCRVRLCVNPDHLQPVTRAVNLERGFGGPGLNRRKTTCPKGHLLDGKRSNGSRYCLTCHRERQRPKTCTAGHPWIEENIEVTSGGRTRCRVCAETKGQALPAGASAMTPEDAYRLGVTQGLQAQADAPVDPLTVAAMVETEHRRKYMREYMRDRRARERTEKITAVAEGAT